MIKKKEVRVGKIDLDTITTAYLLGITREDEVKVVRGNALDKDLTDESIICIEVGGPSHVGLNNWDHHDPEGPTRSAAWQVFYQVGKQREDTIPRLVEYVDVLDCKGPQALAEKSGGNVQFPTLSDVVAGMLLTERDSVEQLHKGIALLEKVVTDGQDPFGTIAGFDAYAEAKADNNRLIAEAVKDARWDTTQSGDKIGYLETEFFGAPGALYGRGAKVVVVYNPNFGPQGVPKFTVAGNGVKVDGILPELNALEEGWGGPSTGTIIGSPREGTKLTLDQVVEIAKSI